MVNVLYKAQKQNSKRKFNPAATEDLRVYRDFIKHGSWTYNKTDKVFYGAPCPFELEWPYTSIPHMIADKIATHVVEAVTD